MKQSRNQLKQGLMEQMEAAIDQLLDWQEAHPTLTMTELEDFVLKLWHELGQEMAQRVLGQMDSQAVLNGLRCEDCGEAMVYKGQSEKHVETRLGGLALERGRYWCPHCKGGVFPPG